MGTRWAGLILVLAANLAISAGVMAQSAPQRSAAAQSIGSAPDSAGAWAMNLPVDPKIPDARPEIYFSREEPSMKPEALEKYKLIRKGQGEKRPDYGRADLDPAQYPYCMPFGFPRVFAYLYNFDIVQSSDHVFLVFDSNDVQRIYTDGRKHPVGPPITFMGQSIGHWEGDTLVVETKDINDLTWLDGVGHLHSDALRVEQRIRRVDHDNLQIDFLFNDPKTYNKPWGGRKLFKLKSSKDLAKEISADAFACQDRVTDDFQEKVLGKKEGDDPWREQRKERVGY